MKISRRQFTKATLGAASVAALGSCRTIAGDQPLISKPIPSSGEMLPVIGLGTNRYGVDESDASRAPLRSALDRFNQLGGTVIDTAPMYRTSEAVIGDLVTELGIRDEIFIATKTDRTEGPEATLKQMKQSLSRLRTDTIDLMQVHNLRGWQNALPLMRDWQREGRIRYIGITTSRISQYEEFEKVMRSEQLDFVQVDYSLQQRKAAERILPLAAERGIAVIINRAFGGGRVFGTLADRPVPDWAGEFGAASWAQFLLKFAVGHPAATLTIPGMTKLRHVEDNLEAARGRLPTAKERARQAALFDAL